MKESIFQVGKLIEGPEDEDLSRPWFIVETVLTSDGMRSRICSGRWYTEEAARLVMGEKQKQASE